LIHFYKRTLIYICEFWCALHPCTPWQRPVWWEDYLWGGTDKTKQSRVTNLDRFWIVRNLGMF